MHWPSASRRLSALFPGLSRSGMTISTSLLLGLRGEWAVQFSLLMSIPAILGTAVLKIRDLDPAWLTSDNIIATLLGTAVSTVVGGLALALLVGSVRRGRWWWFRSFNIIATTALVLLSREATRPL